MTRCLTYDLAGLALRPGIKQKLIKNCSVEPGCSGLQWLARLLGWIYEMAIGPGGQGLTLESSLWTRGSEAKVLPAHRPTPLLHHDLFITAA